MAPKVAGHTYIGSSLFGRLYNHVKDHDLGKVFVEGTFVTTALDDSNWVKGSRVPDILFFEKVRWKTYDEENAEWRSRPLALVPDLCVEIVSPSENYTDVNAKVALYFEDGVKLIWIIDPQQRTIAIYERGSDQFTLLGPDRTLLPGFEIALADIFED